MARITYLTDTWEIVKEVDLRPLRQQALRGINISIVGAPGSGRAVLAEQMRCDPARPNMAVDTPLLLLDLDSGDQAIDSDLIILLMDASKPDSSQEQELVLSWHNANKKVLVVINEVELPESRTSAISPWTSRRGQGVVWGSVEDPQFLVRNFAPAVIKLAPDKLLTLGRYFPLFRVPIAHYLINDTCTSNAAYALSTGLAETIAVFDIPIAVADMIILTKNQAYMAYKIGLALGYSTQWKDYVAEFGGVFGGSFIWRELARTLVGFIPVWGLIPKTAISYAGTYVVGHTVLQWYLTGRHITKAQIRQLYKQALSQGKATARGLLDKAPRPKLSRPKLPKLNRPKLSRPKLPRLSRRKALPEPDPLNQCPECEQSSAPDASFCQYCGTSLETHPIEQGPNVPPP